MICCSAANERRGAVAVSQAKCGATVDFSTCWAEHGRTPAVLKHGPALIDVSSSYCRRPARDDSTLADTPIGFHLEACMSKKNAVPAQKVDPYVRSIVSDLEGPFDREAVRLMLSVGVYANDTIPLHEAITRLSPDEPDKDPSFEALDRAEAAYLLGIAVGRRLGSAPLAVK